MMKRTVSFFITFLCFSRFAFGLDCGQAVPVNHPNFCASFKSIAQCHCITSGLPRGMCLDMNVIYDRMIATFGSVQAACQYQKETTPQNCIDDWNCYRVGGSSSQGLICSSTGRACQ